MSWEIGFFAISIAVLLLVIFAIPTLLQIRRTARNAEITLEAINRELPSILKDVQQITTLTNEFSHSVRFHIEEKISQTAQFNLRLLEGLSKRVGGTLQRLHDGIGRLSAGFDSLHGDYTGIEGRIERELRSKSIVGLKALVLLIRTARSTLESLRPVG